MPVKASNDDPDGAAFSRGRAAHLDDAYTLARYLLRNANDAEDAVQECYLRAFKHFDSYRGPARSLAVRDRATSAARNIRAARPPTSAAETCRKHGSDPLWREAQERRKPRCCGNGMATPSAV
jgi:RNA polymerase sigma-70 factor (ECF subfamily)